MSEKKTPSTALVSRTADTLDAREARLMTEWRYVFGAAPLRLHLTTLDEGCFAIEHVEPERIKDDESYLIIESSTNRLIGILRDGMLDVDPYRPGPAKTACTAFRAAKA